MKRARGFRSWVIAAAFVAGCAGGAVVVATGRGHMVYRNADGSTRVSDYYSFNAFERRDGRWLYVAAFLP